MLNTIEEALHELRIGNVIIVVDDEDRENEGDFVVAAEKATPDIINFMLHKGRGILCVALPQKRCDELGLQMMEANNTSLLGTPFTVSVDFVDEHFTTGVSSIERAATIKALVDPGVKPGNFGRPGHIFPLRAQDKGVLERNGHTEAVVDLTKLAGLKQGGALIEIMNGDGTMARLPELMEIAKEYQLKIVSIADLKAYRMLQKK
ncbi:MAG: 3,4-dihydroxy-2-butanone-4-phosphate synthase [Dysgonamonadaceae bacterium]